MIAEDPISPIRIGLAPATSAGKHELDQDEAGEAQPEQRREAAPSGDGDHDHGEQQGDDQQRRAAGEVGELVLRRLPVDRRHPDQLDLLPHLGAGGVERTGQGDLDLRTRVVALQHLGGELGAPGVGLARGGAGQALAGALGRRR